MDLLALCVIMQFKQFFSDSGGLRTELTKGTIGSFSLKLVYALLAMALSIFLARSLGAEGYGIFAFAFTVMTLMTVPIQVGLPTLVVREVAKYQQDKQWGLIKGLLKRASQGILLMWLVISLIGLAIYWGLGGSINSIQSMTILWAILLLPLLALNRLCRFSIKSSRE